MAPDWSNQVEDYIRRHARSSGILIGPVDAASVLPPGWECQYCRVDSTPLSEQRALLDIVCSEAVVDVPADRVHEYGRFMAGFFRIRVHGGRRFIDGRDCCGRVLIRMVFLRLILACNWMMLITLKHLLYLASPLLWLTGKVFSGRCWSDCRLFSAMLAGWRIELSHIRTFYPARWNMLRSYIWSFCMQPWRVADPAQVEPTRLLVIYPDLIGDTLTAVPFLRAVKTQLPGCTIHFLASVKGAAVLQNNPFIDRLMIYGQWNPNYHYGEDAPRRRARAYSYGPSPETEYDAVVYYSWWPERADLLNAIAPAVLLARDLDDMLFWGAKRLRLPVNCYEAADGFCIGLGLRPPSDHRPEVFFSEEELVQRRSLMPPVGCGPVRIGIQTWSPFLTKRYPVAVFQEFMELMIDRLGREGVEFYIFDPRNLFWAGWKHAGISVRFWGDAPLREACTALSTCAVLVANDGGLAHVAAACNVPEVVIFSSFSPDQWLPLDHAAIGISNALDCSPCGRRHCPLRLECHAGIGSGALVDAVHRLGVLK